MPNKAESQIHASDLPMTLYLNQRLTFDLLATLEEGFSSLSTVQTTFSDVNESELSGKAQLGFSNAFAFLGVKLGGHGSRQTGHSQTESITENIVHTPASLFAHLRRSLQDQGLVRVLSESSDLEKINNSDFVEFEATLGRTRVLVQLAALAQLIPVMAAFEEPKELNLSSQQSKSNKAKHRQRQLRNQTDPQVEQIKSILEALTTGDSQDLISNLGGINVVVTTERQYFVDPTMNDIIDGTFRVFGKVIRIIGEDSADTISLLRKAPFGQFKALIVAFEELINQLSNDLRYSDETTDGNTSIEIQGPAVQVVPIAIFS